MKKVISVLAVLMIITGAVFAATNDALNITAKVPEAKPAFSIYGGTAAGSETTLGTNPAATIATNVDISTTDITIYCKLTQNVKSKYKNTTGVTLTVTPTALVNSVDAESKTALPTPSTPANGTVTNATITSAKNDSTKVITYTVKYNGKPVAANSVIGTFNYTWTHDENLSVGETYSATITLTYTVD